MDPALIVVGALLLLGKGKPSKKESEDDGARILARANQPRALEWATTFMMPGVDAAADLAAAYARWAGIESSGDPLATSKIGERGLFQATKTTALTEHALTQQQWAALQSPGTTRLEHARIAMDLANWLYTRATKYIVNPPKDYISAVWYAKLYHQRPADFPKAGFHGPALPMARELGHAWADDAAKMHRLRVANVVAFGVPDP